MKPSIDLSSTNRREIDGLNQALQEKEGEVQRLMFELESCKEELSMGLKRPCA
jgi:hypothetical protein